VLKRGNAHRVFQGTRACHHTCRATPCLNKEGEVQWKNEGGSLKRHESSKGVHPSCSPLCPGWISLTAKWGKNSAESDIRQPANDEASESSQSTKRARTCASVEIGPSISQKQEESPLPIFRLLFIQDPDWRKARNIVFRGHETVWTKTTISKGRWQELAANKGSEGFMHRCKPNEDDGDVLMDGLVHVYIDEWVGKFIISDLCSCSYNQR
jgi:hypothetical protein